MLLRCVKPYRNGPRSLVYEAGQEFEVDEELQQFLFSDAPGCFEEATVKAVKAPTRDKAVRSPKRAK